MQHEKQVGSCKRASFSPWERRKADALGRSGLVHLHIRLAVHLGNGQGLGDKPAVMMTMMIFSQLQCMLESSITFGCSVCLPTCMENGWEEGTAE